MKIIEVDGVQVNTVKISYERPPGTNPIIQNVPDDITVLMRQCFDEEQIDYKEFFFALYLSSHRQVLGVACIGVGNEDAVIATPDEVAALALLLRARHAFIAHNHTDGSLEFSPADIEGTKDVARALNTIGCALVDHLLYTKDGVRSMKLSHPEVLGGPELHVVSIHLNPES